MINAIIQARVGSTRLPSKVFAEIEGKPFLWHVVNRLKQSKYLDSIIIATTINKNDDIIASWSEENDVKCYRGSENNVLERYYEAAKHYSSETIIRITADDPFKDYQIMDAVIEKFQTEGVDFACNNNPPSYPEGIDIEVFSFEAIEKAYLNAKSTFEKEHVTQYFYKNPETFKISNLKNKENLSSLRWTVDEEKDLVMTRKVYSELFPIKEVFLMNDILELINEKPEIAAINDEVNRSVMYKK
jgi:spore coat polysaccharide biosynthesis protein SpsF